MWGSDDPFCRKPMAWADLPPNDDPEERVDEGHLAAYRAMIGLRNELPALRRGSFRTLLADDARNTWVFERELDGQRVVVAVNASAVTQDVRLDASVLGGRAWRVAFGGGEGDLLGLPPLSGRVLVSDRAPPAR